MHRSYYGVTADKLSCNPEGRRWRLTNKNPAAAKRCCTGTCHTLYLRSEAKYDTDQLGPDVSEREEHMQNVPTESSQLCNTGKQQQMGGREGGREGETDLDQKMVAIST